MKSQRKIVYWVKPARYHLRLIRKAYFLGKILAIKN